MKRFILLAIALLSLIPLTISGAPKRELRSVWFTTYCAIDWPSSRGTSASVIAAQKAQIDSYLDNFQARNFNGVCFQVRALCDAMYQSSYEPWSQYLTGTRGTNPGWDPLAYAVEECHKRGMECWAWVNPFRYKASNTTYSTTQDKNLEATGWLLNYSSYTVLNPGIAAARNRILAVAKEIYTNYKIDGMLFDDYFYPNAIPETSSAGDYTLWKNSGTSLSIGNWRRENINTFMRELRAQINNDRPDMRFGVSPAGVAYLGAYQYGYSKPNVSTTDWQYGTIYSDPIAWLHDGSVDFISPQIYWPTTSSAAPFGPLCSWWSVVASDFSRHFFSSSATYLLNDGTLSNSTTGWSELSTQVNLTRTNTKNSSPGVIWYSARYIDGPGLSGLGNYLVTNNYQTKALVPKVTWRSRTAMAAPTTLTCASNTLSWNAVSGPRSNSIVRYTVYAIPNSVKKIDDAMASDGDGIKHDYLLGMSYSTSYYIPSAKQDGYWYAVCSLDGYGYESTPKTLWEPQQDPVITAGQSAGTFKCEYGKTAMNTFSCSAANLTQDITVTSNSSVFQVTLTTLTRTGGWIDVKFVPTSKGTFTGTLTIASGTAKATIALTGTATTPIPVFTEKWNISDYRDNTTSMGWDATLIRNIAYNQGKLYMVYDQQDIKVINAQTGADLGNLNKWKVDGGTVKIADVKICDGKLVASNIALTRNDDPFKLYVWDDDHSNPRVILTTYDFGGGVRVGDYIGFKGTWDSGEFLFCTDDGTYTRLLHYAVTGGVVNPTPTVTYITTDGTTQLPTSISARVLPEDDGYWIDGRQNLTTFVDLNGKQKFAINQYPTWGNSFKAFSYMNSYFGMCTVYDTSVAYTKGRMRLFCADNGWANTETLAEYPSEGLSDTRTNGNCTSGIMTSGSGGQMEVWISSTNQGLAYYTSSGYTPPTYNVEAIRPIKPYIMTSRSYTNITAKTGVATSMPITLAGAFHTDDLLLEMTGADADKFWLSTDRISASAEAQTVYINFLSDEEGSYSAQLVATSEGCDPVNVIVNAQSSKAGYFNDHLEKMDEKWVYSTGRSNLGAASWFDAADHPTRDICVANFKLYVLNSKAWDSDPRIAVVGAYGGVFDRYLRMDGVSGGEIAAASIRELGGHVIMSNSARAAGSGSSSETDPLKVYKWYNDDCAPVLWMQDNEHGGIHVGDIMSVYGDMTSGKVIFCDGSTLLVYPVTLGFLSSTPEVIHLTREGYPYTVGNVRGVASVTMLDDGTFWVTGKDSYATRFSATGAYIEDFSNLSVTGGQQGTSSTFFGIGNRRYMATATYLNTTETWNKMTEGAMTIVDYTEGVASANTVAVYPEEGLGSVNNTSYQTAVVSEQSTDGERLNLWVMVPQQGIAYYKYDAAANTGTTSIDSILSSAYEETYYNLQGMRVDKDRLTPGIYIRLRDGLSEKVVVN